MPFLLYLRRLFGAPTTGAPSRNRPALGVPPLRRASLIALCLLIFLPLVVSSGCGLLSPPLKVAENAQQALSDGSAKKADAVAAAKNGDKTEAADRWQKVAAYYAAVAGKFSGTDNGLRATIEQARALDEGTNNKQAAEHLLRAALRQYKPADFPEARQEAQTYYDDVVRRLDEENSQTFYYKIMDTIVRGLGNNPRVSPVVAIFVIAVTVTLLVWPFRLMQYRSFKEMQRWQPELQKLQAKYKDNPQDFMGKRQEFMKQHGINEFAGCLPLLLQWPITLLMYQVILHYQFHFTQSSFLWINNAAGQVSANLPWPLTGAFGHHLGEQDLPMLVVYAISMFLTTKLMPTTPPADPQQAEQQRTMTVMMPAIFFIMMLQWQPASAFVLYWFVSNVLALGQQWIIYKTLPTPPPLIISAESSSDSTPKPLAANPKLVSPKNKRK